MMENFEVKIESVINFTSGKGISGGLHIFTF